MKNQETKNIVTSKMNKQTLRNLMLEISEIDETRNPFKVAYNIMIALKYGEITSDQYTLLTGELQFNCIRYGIETKNEICSLF